MVEMVEVERHVEGLAYLEGIQFVVHPNMIEKKDEN